MTHRTSTAHVVFILFGILLLVCIAGSAVWIFPPGVQSDGVDAASVGKAVEPDSGLRIAALEKDLQHMDSVLGQAMDSQARALEQRMSRVEGQLADLIDVLDEFAGRSVSEPEEQQAASAQEDIVLEFKNRAEQADAALAEKRLLRHQSYFAEGVDPNWSVPAVSRIQESLAALPAGVQVSSVDCRESTCRLEVNFESEMDLGMFLLEFAVQVHEDLPGMVVFNDTASDGALASEVYLTRRSVSGRAGAGQQ